MDVKIKADSELLILLMLILVYTLLVSNLVLGFKQLPSPIYGGDYYIQMGVVCNVMYNTPMHWFDGSIPGSKPGYLPIYAIVIGTFGKLLGLTPMQAMLYFNFFFPLITIIIAYFLFKKIFKDKRAAVLGVILFLPLTSFPILKYTYFTQYVMIPLFLYALFLFFDSQTIKNALLLGVMGGILSLSHGLGFAIGMWLMGFSFLFLLLKQVSLSGCKIRKSHLAIAAICIVPMIITFLIAQIYWYKAMFVMKLKMVSRQAEWNTNDFSNNAYKIIFLLNTLIERFFPVFQTTSLWKLVCGILAIAGLYALVRYFKRKEKESTEINLEEKNIEFVLVIFLASATLTFSYFVTEPLFGTNLIPPYLNFLIFRVGVIFLSIVGYIYICRIDLAKRYLFYGLVILFFVDLVMSYNQWYNDQWNIVGRRELSPGMIALQNALLKNTQIDDVILSSNELGFLVYALSGRKVIANRRAQMDPYFDFDKTQLAAAIILYGNNTEERVRLLKEMNISYVLYSRDWIMTEWHFDDKGNVIGMFDPLLLFNTEENRKSLERYGIKYVAINTWVDPALKGPEFKKLDVLIITPDNYEISTEGVWKKDLYNYLTPIWTHFEPSTGEYFILYKVTI
jgi:hypothetical protein